MDIFFDTSALAKRFVREKGSDRVNNLFHRSADIWVSILCLPEVFSALNRLKREARIREEQYQEITKVILDEFKVFKICEVTPAVVAHSVLLLEKYPLRALDSLHLASALSVKKVSFVTSDARQLKVARSLHLKVIEV